MKKKFLLLLILFPFTFLLSSAQIPQGFNYQAIARNASGNPITNYPLEVRIMIQSDSISGTLFWDELHSDITTNAFGLFTLIVGKGKRQAGLAATFGDIDWSVTPKFINTMINYGGWINIGSSRLQAVPYAMVAKDLSGTLKKLAVTGATSNLDEALFEVKNQSGQTVFAVYNEGVRIYVDDGIKGAKGGFAVGGFDQAKATSQQFLYVSADSIRAYIGTNPAKGAKGGFAVGGFDQAKAPKEEYLRITRDSTRVYIRNSGKGVKGGFAVGSFDPAKGNAQNFLNLTPDNYFIGQQSGRNTTTGLYNSFLGFEAGLSNTTGWNNSFIGYQAGKANQTGNANTFVGNSAGAGNLGGVSNTFIGTTTGQNFTTGTGNTFMGVAAGNTFLNGNYNVFIGNGAGAGFQFPAGATGGQHNVVIGTGAGFRLVTGSNNIFLGNYSGFNNISGSQNTFLGYQSGLTNSSGTNNIFLGNQSGFSNTIGFNNTFLGYQAGYLNVDGNWNVFIGNSTGYKNTSGVQNVFIGDRAGYYNTSGSQNIFLGLQSGYNNTTGIGNAFVGWNAGLANTEGFNNAFFGLGAGYSNKTAGNNTFLGFSAGLGNQTGEGNAYIGSNAGRSNSTGTGNVVFGESAAYGLTSGNYNTIIGNGAGINLQAGAGNVFIGSGVAGNETNTSNKLFIDNTATDYSGALIYGDFASDYLRLNGNVTVNRLNYPGYGLIVGHLAGQSPAYQSLWVYGDAYATGNFVSGSDERWKKDIKDLPPVLPVIKNIRSVTYSWKVDEYKDMEFDTDQQIGFIAQDVEKYFPQIISYDHNGYKLLDYSRMTVVLLQAIKEQQSQIESQNERIDRLESLLEKLMVEKR